MSFHWGTETSDDERLNSLEIGMFTTRWCNRLKRCMAAEDGPTAVEYAVMLALIVIACVGAVKNMATATGSSFDRSSNAISQALGG